MTAGHSLLQRYQTELGKLLKLSLPIIGAQLAAAGMSFVDVSMAGQYSSLDLAAVAIGSSVWNPTFYLIRGVLMAITPIVAQLLGAGDFREIQHKTRQGIWVTLVVSLLGIAVVLSPAVFFEYLNVNPNIADLGQRYLQALAFGVSAMCMYQLMTSYCEGLSDTRAPMFIGVIALLINIPANYVLIYGKLGMPALGGVGCGYATALCFTLMALMMFIYIRISSKHTQSNPFGHFEWPKFHSIRDHLVLGLPVGIALFIETTIFSIIALMVGNLGVSVVAGHQVALNVASLMYIIPVSLGAGVTIIVGQHLGAGKPHKASFTSFSGILTSLLFGLLIATGIAVYAEQIASIYSWDSAVIALAAELMLFAAVYQIGDSIQLVAIGALRGYKDTRVPMLMVMFSCWVIALPLGYTLAMTNTVVHAMGPHGFWIGLVSALSVSAILNSYRLRKISSRIIDKHNQRHSGFDSQVPSGIAA